MLDLDKSHKGIVTRTEDFGVYLQCDRDLVLVLITDLAWTEGFRTGHEFTQPGKVHDVLVHKFVESEELYVGSIREAHPELNPWLRPSVFSVGSVHLARVCNVAPANDRTSSILNYIVLLPCGLKAFMPGSEQHHRLHVDEPVRVRVTDIDPGRQEILVESTDEAAGFSPARG